MHVCVCMYVYRFAVAYGKCVRVSFGCVYMMCGCLVRVPFAPLNVCACVRLDVRVCECMLCACACQSAQVDFFFIFSMYFFLF